MKEIQNHVLSLKAENIKLKSRLEDLEQYTRRPNVRIYGVPLKNDESVKDVETIVKTLVTDNGISGCSLDRAHRIGRVQEVESEDSETVKMQPIIARFGTFRDRTIFYRARKAIKETSGYGVSLDLTSQRLGILKEARILVENVEGIRFAYSDINCILRVLTSDGQHLAFNTIDDLRCLIAAM